MTRAVDPSSHPFCVFSTVGEPPRVGVAAGEHILDLSAVSSESCFRSPTLNDLMSRGPSFWARVDRLVAQHLATGHDNVGLIPMSHAILHLPVQVTDFVDFYSGIEHATNAGRILRPGQPPLKPNWRELPTGYHGHAGTIVVSGTDVVRPMGQLATSNGRPRLAPTERLDAEVELAFVVGVGSTMGSRVSVSQFRDHVFGAVILIDWSARDIQAYEYDPLGPLLGKSFCTTISPWVVPVSALEDARVDGPEQDPEPLAYLRQDNPRGYDISLGLTVNGHVLSTPSFATMYWTAAQQLAHLTVNGASVRTGDLYASGTVSSFEPAGQGSLLELSWGGTRRVELPDGTWRHYLEDGDEVGVTAVAKGANGVVDFGGAFGRIVPARIDG